MVDLGGPPLQIFNILIRCIEYKLRCFFFFCCALAAQNFWAPLQEKKRESLDILKIQILMRFELSRKAKLSHKMRIKIYKYITKTP